jgi:hypothetical protein
MFGTNPEESYSAGEGGVIYDRLNPELTEKLCERIVSQIDDINHDLLITASPYTKYVLKKFNPKINIISFEKAVHNVMEVCTCQLSH